MNFIAVLLPKIKIMVAPYLKCGKWQYKWWYFWKIEGMNLQNNGVWRMVHHKLMYEQGSWMGLNAWTFFMPSGCALGHKQSFKQKIQKICWKWLILTNFFFWLGRGKWGGRASDWGGKCPHAPLDAATVVEQMRSSVKLDNATFYHVTILWLPSTRE